VVVPGQDAGAVGGQRAREGLEHADAADFGLADPVVEEATGGRFGRLIPQPPQVVFIRDRFFKRLVTRICG